MKHFLFFLTLVASSLSAASQGRPFKEVVIDLDSHRSDSMLPIEESFYLKFVSTGPINLSNYRLLRIRKKASGKIYWKNIPFENVPAGVSVENLPKPIKVTLTNSQKTAPAALAAEVTNTSVAEHSNNPIAKNTITILLPPLTPNFYYYLFQVSTHAGAGVAIDAGNLPVATYPLRTQIIANTTTPLGNTALGQSENMNRQISAIVGLAYIPLKNESVAPYLGLRYNFLSANKWVRQGIREMKNQGSSKLNRVFSNMAFDVGLTLTSLEDTNYRVKDLSGKINVLTGFGYRLSNFAFLSSGVVWYKKVDEADKTRTKIRNKFYASLSLDWDIAKTFNSFGKLLGIAY